MDAHASSPRSSKALVTTSLTTGIVTVAQGPTNDAGTSAPPDSSGPDGGIAHTVSTCDGLHGIGQWENITPPSVTLTQNGVLHVVQDPTHVGTLYLGIDLNGIWRSDDCGGSWTKVSTG